MAALKVESELYKELSALYDKSKGEITLAVYKSAIEIAQKYEKVEIQFVLFKLRYVNSDVNTGFAGVDKCINFSTKILTNLTGKQYKLAFIYSVLETQ